jgi:limonene-1,2-epoxide hydrolase
MLVFLLIMKHKQLINMWVELFNRKDVDELVELYHKDAINHQVPNEPVNGKYEIKKMLINEFATAEMTCIVENIFEDGDWAILEWKDPLGLRGCGFFHILDGKIKLQRGYWDKLTFLKQHNLPISTE